MSLRLALPVLAFLAFDAAPLLRSRDFTPYLIADRSAEIVLARSAAPPSVSDSATVLVLTRSGYTQVARGNNGFTCLVLRSFAARLDDKDFFNPAVRAPICFNAPATQTVVPEMLKRAEWVLADVGLADIGARTARAYATRQFPRPAPGAMSFMLSHNQHLSESDPHWMPHLMFFEDAALPLSSWGAEGEHSPIIVDAGSDTKSPVVTLMIPVRRWSDGTVSATPAGH